MTYQITLFFLMSFLSKSLIKGFNEVIYAILSTFTTKSRISIDGPFVSW